MISIDFSYDFLDFHWFLLWFPWDLCVADGVLPGPQKSYDSLGKSGHSADSLQKNSVLDALSKNNKYNNNLWFTLLTSIIYLISISFPYDFLWIFFFSFLCNFFQDLSLSLLFSFLSFTSLLFFLSFFLHTFLFTYVSLHPLS